MAYMSTMPGFSSRSSVHIVTQFPHRDEAAMSEHEPEPGFSNSEPVEDAPQDVTPDVQTPPDEVEPGFSNAKAVKSDEAPAAESADDSDSEDEKPAKPAAKKSAAKKKG